jgi:transposase
MRKHYTEAQKAALLELVTTGTPLRAAARQLQVGKSTAYRWIKRARPASPPVHGAAASRPPPRRATFARLIRAPADRTAMTLRVGGAAIEVHAGFDAALLRALIAALEAPAS